ncbi:hypothetical protein [Rhodopseudomonas palustris]|uniref:Sulfotransferase family protein n=1 Tax=Rhodopseudomonas palustris (strain BisB18) TaxID=316056 RepID=Q21D95_RHOPB
MAPPVTPHDRLQLLADRVRRQDPSLETLLLEPDGKYQTRRVTLDVLMREMTDCLAAGFAGRAATDFPMHYLAWGKCRVGSTALTNLFGVTGMPSYYQPLKMMLRHLFVGQQPAPWIIPRAADQPQIFSKETAGPYVVAESLFNPLRLLIEAGYPPHRLQLIMLDREPKSSLASSLDKLAGCVPDAMLLQNYVVAALNATRIESYARQQGVPVIHYVYEASKEAVRSVRTLFDRLGLAGRFSETAVTDWRNTGKLRSDSSRITFGDEPSIYDVAGLHGADTAYRYHPRDTETLSAYQRDMLERCGVNEVYRGSVEACIRDLGLDAATAARLFSHTVTHEPA